MVLFFSEPPTPQRSMVTTALFCSLAFVHSIYKWDDTGLCLLCLDYSQHSEYSPSSLCCYKGQACFQRLNNIPEGKATPYLSVCLSFHSYLGCSHTNTVWTTMQMDTGTEMSFESTDFSFQWVCIRGWLVTCSLFFTVWRAHTLLATLAVIIDHLTKVTQAFLFPVPSVTPLPLFSLILATLISVKRYLITD